MILISTLCVFYWLRLQVEVDAVMGSKSFVEFEDLSQLKFCSQVLKETLRLFPPATATARTNLEEVSVDGFRFPANSWIIVRCCFVSLTATTTAAAVNTAYSAVSTNHTHIACVMAVKRLLFNVAQFEHKSPTQLGFPANCITNAYYFLQLKMYRQYHRTKFCQASHTPHSEFQCRQQACTQWRHGGSCPSNGCVTVHNIILSGEAILSAEKNGLHLGSRGSSPNPTGEEQEPR